MRLFFTYASTLDYDYSGLVWANKESDAAQIFISDVLLPMIKDMDDDGRKELWEDIVLEGTGGVRVGALTLSMPAQPTAIPLTNACFDVQIPTTLILHTRLVFA
jgi:hypothetical protein